MDIAVVRMKGIEVRREALRVLREGLAGARASLYGVHSVQFSTQTPGARRFMPISHVTLVHMGQSLALPDKPLVDLALKDLQAIKAEAPQYPVIVVVDGLNEEVETRLRRLGLEGIDSRALDTARQVRNLVENKIIELRLGISPPVQLEEILDSTAGDANVVQAIKYEFSGATPPAKLWESTPVGQRRNLLITFTYVARACRRLAARFVEGRCNPSAFVLTQRPAAYFKALARSSGSIFRFRKRELRVSLAGIHQGDIEEIARVAEWPGAFVVLDDMAMIRGVVATPASIIRQCSATGEEPLGMVLRTGAEIGFMVPGDRTVRVFTGNQEVLRHDGFEWRPNNREAVRTVFVRTCTEIGVNPRTAQSCFDAALLLAQSNFGCFVIVGDTEDVEGVMERSVPLDAHLDAALRFRVLAQASPTVIATLAKHDGAVVVGKTGTIMGFGRLIRTRQAPQDDGTHGTKHATAAQVTREGERVCALVVSQDGPTSVYFGGSLVARTQF